MKNLKLVLSLTLLLACLISHAQDSLQNGAIISNNKALVFLNGSGSDDGSGIIRPGGNAFRLKYKTNSLIFDALDDWPVKILDSSGGTKIVLHPTGNSYFNGGKVGIGTSLPSSLLNVVGTNGFKWEYQDNDNQGKLVIGEGSSTANPAIKFYRWTGSGATYYPGHIEMSQTSGVGRMDFNIGPNSALGSESLITAMSIEQTGNVGIGTSTPSELLHVAGKAKFGSQVELSSSNFPVLKLSRTSGHGQLATIGQIDFYEGAYDNAVSSRIAGTRGPGTSGRGELAFSTLVSSGNSLQERMRITRIGYVGIGTTTPNSKLDVIGQIRTNYDASTSLGGSINIDNPAGTIPAISMDQGGTRWWQYVESDNTFRIGRGSNYNSNVAAISLSGDNVGVGIANPNSNLHIYEQATSGQDHVINSWTTSSGGGVSLRISDLSMSNPGWQLNTFAGEPLSFSQGGADRMSIDSNGNVGIGTTSPNAKLDVAGDSIIFQHDSSVGKILFDTQDGGIELTDGENHMSYIDFRGMDNGANGTDFRGRILYNDGHATAFSGTKGLFFQAGGGGYGMSLTESGDVGIGTFQPNYKLDVAGTINATGILVNGNPVSTTTPYWNEASGDINFSSGDVGIGTTTPEEALDVNGNVQVSANISSGRTSVTNLQLATHSWSGSHGILFNAYKNITVNGSLGSPGNTRFANNEGSHVGGAGAIMFYANGGTMDFNISSASGQNGADTDIDWGTPKMRINRSGEVGIGTLDVDGFKLSVAGDIRAEEIKVEASPWPDYVFEENYKLRSLESLEKFIKSHNHLPEIPSAKEIEENGLELGDMNMRLLKKIEELTLYQIEMMKMIKTQQEEIQMLKNKN